MEAEQFRRVAEERIQHDEDTLAFLKAVIFHQEMEISSLNRRLLVVHAAGDGDDPFSPAVVDLPWLRKLAKNGAPSRRNASLPAAHLEELCSELDVVAGADDKTYPCKNVGDRRPARTVSDIGEVIGREKEWARPNQPPSVSHRLRRAPSYSAQCDVRSARTSPEIIAEEDEKVSKNNAALEADIEQIKGTVQSLASELTKLRESTVSIGDEQSRLLTEIHSKLDGAMPQQHSVQGGHGSSPVQVKATSREQGSSSSSKTKGHPVQVKKASREQGSSSSSKGQSHQLLMNHFIEVCGLTFSSLIRVAASMSLVRCLLILILAVAIRKVLMNSYV
uniref:GTD-binding domain-containing protein n=1 Tax=Arundo donax TaxID=35708 RepID=A0A0A9GFA7_ARUDO